MFRLQPGRSLRFDLCGLCVVACLLLPTSGCDKAEELAAEAKSAIKGDSDDPSADSDSQPAQPAATSATDTAPDTNSQPPTPNPADLYAHFSQLTPELVSDGEIAAIAAVAEAASMVREIATSSLEFTATGIQTLSRFENLESVTISNPRLKPDHLALLARIPSLKKIVLAAMEVDDSVVARFTSLPQLTTLDISATRITPAAGGSLKQISTLTDLNLRRTLTDDQTILEISQLPLQKLNVAQTRITNASIPVLLKMATLQDLDVSSNTIDGTAFKGITSSNLKVLNVSETGFGIEGFASLRGMKSLEELYAFNAGLVQHQKADVFKTLRNLKVLNVGGNAIGDPGVIRFFKGHPALQHLKLDNNREITDNALQAFVGMKTLRLLELRNTRVTAQGAQALKQRLPDCTIRYPDGEI